MGRVAKGLCEITVLTTPARITARRPTAGRGNANTLAAGRIGPPLVLRYRKLFLPINHRRFHRQRAVATYSTKNGAGWLIRPVDPLPAAGAANHFRFRHEINRLRRLEGRTTMQVKGSKCVRKFRNRRRVQGFQEDGRARVYPKASSGSCLGKATPSSPRSRSPCGAPDRPVIIGNSRDHEDVGAQKLR
jgi:hypothetical protein